MKVAPARGVNVVERPFAAEIELPRQVQMEAVGECSLSIRSPAFMSFGAFSNMLAQFPTLERLVLQGRGDPLAHPRFCDMVALAAARRIEVSARSPLKALSERLAEELVQCGLRRLEILVDPLRPAGAMRHAARLNGVKLRLGATQPDICIVAVAMRRNAASLASLVRLVHQLDLPGLQIRHLAHDSSHTRRFVDAESLMGEDAGVFAAARAAADELGVELVLPPQPNAVPGCDRPSQGAYINYYGRAMPCEMVGTSSRLGFGNMHREGVARVWNSDAYRQFREGLAAGDPSEVCKNCAVYRGLR
ncbi:MAG TPA: SPASM domain-containing protein [Burkholderiales bacterium]|nr:SPASM domain-containing protein [Burkholderiales bacterium]